MPMNCTRRALALGCSTVLLGLTVIDAWAAGHEPGVLIFGGTRGVGLETVRLLRDRGEAVTVLVRESSDTDALATTGATLVVGDALDRAAVDAAIASGDYRAVISTLSGKGKGGRYADSEGNINAIDAAKAAGIDRFLLVSSLGVGNSEKALPWIARFMLSSFLEHKEMAENHLFASGLDYTVIRPGNLGDGEPSPRATLITDPTVGGGISRRDVARLLVDALDDPATYGQVYSAINQ